MKQMIEDLFEVIKMDHGDIKLNRTSINFLELCEQVIAENSELFEQNKLDLLIKLPQTPVTLELDGNQIWRVLENLLGNAAKYSLESSRVHFKVEELAEEVQVILKNISKYLLDEDAEKLVERFGRGDQSRHSEGNGLGLAIVDSIVKLHGGTVKIIIDGDMFKVILTLPKQLVDNIE
jgi:signal transduction histidine kinase